jgi:hypothetical protein
MKMYTLYSNAEWPWNFYAEALGSRHLSTLPDDWEETISIVLLCLDERERRVVLNKYRLGLKGKALSADAGKNGEAVSAEAVKRVLQLSFRKLREPFRQRLLVFGLRRIELMDDSDNAAVVAGWQTLTSAVLKNIDPFIRLDVGFYKHIDTYEVGFSERAKNCLMRGGVLTIQNLLDKTPEELLALKGVGEEVLHEVFTFVSKYGLKGRINEAV